MRRVEVELGGGARRLDSRQGPRLVLPSHRAPPGKCCRLACAYVRSGKKYFQPHDGVEGERQWLFSPQSTQLSSPAIKASSDFRLRKRRRPKSPSHITAAMQKWCFSSKTQQTRLTDQTNPDARSRDFGWPSPKCTKPRVSLSGHHAVSGFITYETPLILKLRRFI